LAILFSGKYLFSMKEGENMLPMPPFSVLINLIAGLRSYYKFMFHYLLIGGIFTAVIFVYIVLRTKRAENPVGK